VSQVHRVELITMLPFPSLSASSMSNALGLFLTLAIIDRSIRFFSLDQYSETGRKDIVQVWLESHREVGINGKARSYLPHWRKQTKSIRILFMGDTRSLSTRSTTNVIIICSSTASSAAVHLNATGDRIVKTARALEGEMKLKDSITHQRPSLPTRYCARSVMLYQELYMISRLRIPSSSDRANGV